MKHPTSSTEATYKSETNNNGKSSDRFSNWKQFN